MVGLWGLGCFFVDSRVESKMKTHEIPPNMFFITIFFERFKSVGACLAEVIAEKTISEMLLGLQSQKLQMVTYA